MPLLVDDRGQMEEGMQGLKRNKIKVSMLILSILLIASVGVYVYNRYHTKPVMIPSCKRI
ncbi:hypothetical protein [Legionella israelensis]|uniref:hypothetical protein n=1 Tax=Legionella israelensis TaxID=454 RepID=UPI0010748EE1|nr:hypothetical protein [Legionella israelensis]QBS10294.1 hypothetical protein E4T55_10745 [Legionella israelensis]